VPRRDAALKELEKSRFGVTAGRCWRVSPVNYVHDLLALFGSSPGKSSANRLAIHPMTRYSGPNRTSGGNSWRFAARWDSTVETVEHFCVDFLKSTSAPCVVGPTQQAHASHLEIGEPSPFRVD